MKKLICFLMSAILLLSVFSCRKSNNEATTAGDSQKNETNDTTVAGSQPSEATTEFQSWLTDSMEKVTGDATAPQSASAEIDIYMAKNEKQ
jgi:hypothetical protein